MRLFIAINFSSEEKSKLSSIIADLKKYTVGGNFTRSENLHLTLVFLGETGRLADIMSAMDKVIASAFTLNLKGIGRFSRREGDIYWVGVEENKVLLNIYEQLYASLSSNDFTLEKRKFKPHLTIGRKVILKKGFSPTDFDRGLEPIKIEVTKISLMESKRVEGKLIYTPLYSKQLV